MSGPSAIPESGAPPASAGQAHAGRFNPHIHGARGLFSGMVFVHHIANSGLPTFASFATPAAMRVLGTLQFGVELFFGISGIVIIGALDRSPGVAAFVWDRVTRILPVLWATVAVLIGYGLLRHQGLPDAITIAGNLIPTPSPFTVHLLNPASWSLRFELLFYLLAGLAWGLRGQRVLAGAIIAFGLVYLVFYPRAMLMVAGVLIARGAIGSRRLGGFGRRPGLCLLAFLGCWLAAALVIDRAYPFGPAFLPIDRWAASVPFLAAGFVFGTLTLAGITEGEGRLSRLLTTRPMLWLGTVSYSFYLWHPIVVAAVKQAMQRGGLVPGVGALAQVTLFALSFPPALAIAWASQRVIEGHATRWLRSIGPRKPAGPVNVFLARSHQAPGAPVEAPIGAR